MYDSDRTLIEALIRQDEQAYRYAVTEYHQGMLHLARSIIGERFADEVVQEAWVSVMRALPKFEGRSKLRTWILTIVSNEAKNRLRRENRMVSLDGLNGEEEGMEDKFTAKGRWRDGPQQWEWETPADILSTEQLATCMNLAIQQLPPLQAATLQLKERQAFSLAEICNILEVSESNVRVLLHRARNKLFSVIDHFQETGECCTQVAA